VNEDWVRKSVFWYCFVALPLFGMAVMTLGLSTALPDQEGPLTMTAVLLAVAEIAAVWRAIWCARQAGKERVGDDGR